MSDHPKTYKAVVQKEKGKPFEIVDVDWKDPQPGQVVVKVLACGVCHSDSIVKEEIFPVLPRIPGHEIVGDVVAVGEGVNNFKAGDRVGSGWHGGHCHECSQCAQGHYTLCENENINGIKSDGGYAEYATLQANAVAKIPTSIDPAEAAPLFCAGVTTYNSIRNMGIKAGETVAIQGLGGLGHLAVQYASKMGYNVVVLSSSDAKKDLAKELGANHYLNAKEVDLVEGLNKLGGAKLIVATAPNKDIIGTLINGLAADGTLCLLAVPDGDLTVPGMPLITKRLSLRGWPSGSAEDSRQTVDFSIAQDVKCYIQKYGLEDADKAYEDMHNGRARFRGVLVPGYKSSSS